MRERAASILRRMVESVPEPIEPEDPLVRAYRKGFIDAQREASYLAADYVPDPMVDTHLEISERIAALPLPKVAR